MRSVVFLLCLSVLPSAAAAEESKLEINLASIQVGTQKPGFDEWNGRIQAARSRRTRGSRIVMAGVGVIVLSNFVGGSSEGGLKAQLAVSLIGAAVTGYGGYLWHTARQRIEDLDLEGRTKGYLSLAPTRGGAVATYAYSF